MNSIVIYNDPNLFSSRSSTKARNFSAGCSWPESGYSHQVPEYTVRNLHCTTSPLRFSSLLSRTRGPTAYRPFWIACVPGGFTFVKRYTNHSKAFVLKIIVQFHHIGISIRQGPHHEAQKSMIFNFPFTLYSDTCPLSGVGKVKSGAWAAIYYK